MYILRYLLATSLSLVAVSCRAKPVSNCFETVALSPNIPKSGRCEATGFILETEGTHVLSIDKYNIDFLPSEVVFVGSDWVYRGEEVFENIGNVVRIRGRFASESGLVMSIVRTEEFEVIEENSDTK